MLLLWMVAPATSYTCNVLTDVSTVVTYASATPGQYDGPAVVGPRPTFFVRDQNELPPVLEHDGTLVPVDYEIVRDTLLNRVNGLITFAVSTELEAGTYCRPAGLDCAATDAPCTPLYGQCFDVTATLDKAPPTIYGSLYASEKFDRAEGCGHSDDCGPAHRPRSAFISASVARADAPRVAGYVADIFWGDENNHLAVTNLFGSSAGSGITIDHSNAAGSIDQFDGLCVSLTPLFWDGSFATPTSLGCQAFQ